MRIDRIEIQNFKKFKNFSMDLHPQFNLLIGENGSGKTSLLDALAVGIKIGWKYVGSPLGRSDILLEEIHVEAQMAGDRKQFKTIFPSVISIFGMTENRDAEIWRWTERRKNELGRSEIDEQIQVNTYIKRWKEEAEANLVPLPVLAYYGSDRAALLSKKTENIRMRRPQRLEAYQDCLSDKIQEDSFRQWFLFESVGGNGSHKDRPGFKAVKRAILNSIPGADGVRFDSDLADIVLSIDKKEQPFQNLSAGQRVMLAMIADIAIKAVTLNSYLFGSDEAGAGDPGIVLKETPGVVLIDELDVHLHPRWQRRIVDDLKRTFPKIQFIATSHSPQIIGELKREEIRILTGEGGFPPDISFGLDSSRVLEEVMDAPVRNEKVKDVLDKLNRDLDLEDLKSAQKRLRSLEKLLGRDDPEVVGARAAIKFLAPAEGDE